MEYKIGDWVEITSLEYNNIREEGYTIGITFQVAKCDEIGDNGMQWLCPRGSGVWGVNAISVRPAKNKIVRDILKDL